MPYDRLSALDASFLHLERLETPMHVGRAHRSSRAPRSSTTRGRFRLAEVRELVASRLHLIPRFRKRIMSRAVRRRAGRSGSTTTASTSRTTCASPRCPRPGTREQLLALIERIQAQLLDRTRPLWELWFVEGLEGGNVALIQKTHHALVDGVSGVDVATVLLDFTPEPTFLDAAGVGSSSRAPSPARLLVDTLDERVDRAGGDRATRPRASSAAPQRALDAHRPARARRCSTLVDGDSSRRGRRSTSRSGAAGASSGVQVSLDDVKAIREALGGTVNDVVLAGVARRAARACSSRAGELDPELALKVLCPVSVRDDERAHAARQPGLGDVRRRCRSASPTRSSGSTRSGATTARPEGA